METFKYFLVSAGLIWGGCGTFTVLLAGFLVPDRISWLAWSIELIVLGSWFILALNKAWPFFKLWIKEHQA